MFTGRMKTEIPPALQDLSKGIMFAQAQLTVLDLSDNALGPNGMTGLVDLIKSSACYTLQELRLMNCGLGVTGAKMLAKSLKECYDKSLKNGNPLELRVFAAGRNRLENDGAKALSLVFQDIQTLEEITIPQNGIYHPGMFALAEALKKNLNMKVINFNDNTITAKGAEYLAEAFYAIECLREINLGDCLLRDEGGQILSDVLADCHPDLEYVNLSGNEIGPEIGIALANTMRHKDNLKTFILDCNQFGDDGVQEIQKIMKEFGKSDILSVEDDEGEAEEEEEGRPENFHKIYILLNHVFTDDGEYNEQDETDGESGEEEEEEEEDEQNDDEPVITGSSNVSQVNFETSLNNSKLLNSSNSDDTDPVAVFCNVNSPTLEQFEQITDDDKLSSFKEFLSNAPDEDFLTHLVFTILKLSSISEQSKEAQKLALELLKEAFDYAKNKDRVSFFSISKFLFYKKFKSFQSGQKRPKFFSHSTWSPEGRTKRF
jgi:Ran GTPase-activating protein 1